MHTSYHTLLPFFLSRAVSRFCHYPPVPPHAHTATPYPTHRFLVFHTVLVPLQCLTNCYIGIPWWLYYSGSSVFYLYLCHAWLRTLCPHCCHYTPLPPCLPFLGSIWTYSMYRCCPAHALCSAILPSCGCGFAGQFCAWFRLRRTSQTGGPTCFYIPFTTCISLLVLPSRFCRHPILPTTFRSRTCLPDIHSSRGRRAFDVCIARLLRIYHHNLMRTVASDVCTVPRFTQQQRHGLVFFFRRETQTWRT